MDGGMGTKDGKRWRAMRSILAPCGLVKRPRPADQAYLRRPERTLCQRVAYAGQARTSAIAVGRALQHHAEFGVAQVEKIVGERAATRMTFLRKSAATVLLPFNTRDTVATDTPAVLATSRTVIALPFGRGNLVLCARRSAASLAAFIPAFPLCSLLAQRLLVARLACVIGGV